MAVTAALERLGYQGDLLQPDYRFENWFALRSGVESQTVTLDAAAFGRLPLAHDNACFGVEATDGSDDAAATFLGRCRSLCAPVAIEIAPDRMRLWPVRADVTARVTPTLVPADSIQAFFDSHADDWNPAAMLRAKNIGPVRPRQRDFIDAGLMPAVEEHIRDKLDPLLRETFFAALTTYKRNKATDPQPGKLFRLVFRVLAGKVMTDREVPAFRRFEHSPGPDALLAAVNRHFGDDPRLIADADTRRVVVERLWNSFSLRHISAAILSFIWENTLVDKKVRETLGLYGTPPSVARYIVDRVRLDDAPEDERYVTEPCCGNGVFMLAAMKRLTDLLSPGAYTGRERHNYLKRMLSGFDTDPFGLEVARDCLMLADFPNSNGWVLEEEDVFGTPRQSPKFHERLSEARFVLCNPPFKPAFSEEERRRYKTGSVLKPVELLTRVISGTPKLVGLGFVLPHQVLTGQSFRGVRKLLAERFGAVEVLSLPEKGVYSGVDYGSCAVIAREPRVAGTATSLVHRGVSPHDWQRFVANRLVSREERGTVSVTDAADGIALPDLGEVWSYLRNRPTLADAVQPLDRRGVQWNKPLTTHRKELIVDTDRPGYKLGIASAPRGIFCTYLSPPTSYLSVKPEDRYRNAFDLPWHLPKVIMNANRKGSVHPWRIAAFADSLGLIAYHTFKALWPAAGWSVDLLAAVLNGPLASAYVTAHETGPEITNEVLDVLPMPRLTPQLVSQVEGLVRDYLLTVGRLQLPTSRPQPEAERLLLEIDAAVLRGYDLPPRLERKLLDYFNGFGDKRPVGFPVHDYFPEQFRPTTPLHVYLSTDYRKSTAENFLRVMPAITDPELVEALEEVE